MAPSIQRISGRPLRPPTHEAKPAAPRGSGPAARLTLEGSRARLAGHPSDVMARYGGEEFVIILPETAADGALVRAQRIRECIEEYPFENREVQPGGKLTVSVGVSSFPQDGRTKES